MIFLCTMYVDYPPPEPKWNAEASVNFDGILQLKTYCKKERKWSELSYTQTFFALRYTLYYILNVNVNHRET